MFNNSNFMAVKNGFNANGGFEPPPLWLRHWLVVRIRSAQNSHFSIQQGADN